MDPKRWLACAALALAACAEKAGKAEDLEAKCRAGDVVACERACDGGSKGDGGCLALAEARLAEQVPAESGNDAAEMARRAAKTADAYRKACDGGDVGACLSGASALERRLRIRPGALPGGDAGTPGGGLAAVRLSNAEIALRDALFAKACDLGSAEGCERVAGAKLGADDAGALAAYEKSCAAGGPRRLLDTELDLGFKSEGECLEVRKRVVERARVSRRACSDGRPRGCRRLGRLLAKLDPPRALGAFLEEANLRGPALFPGGAERYALAQLDPAPSGRDAADFGMIGLGGPEGAPKEDLLGPDPADEPPPPMPKEPKGRAVRLGALRVSGRLDPKQIETVLEENRGRFWRCYEKALGKNPNLQGRVAVRLVIDRTGEPFQVANGGSDLPDGAVVACVVRAAGALTFPRPEAGVVTVTAPIMFSPPRP